LKFRGEYPADRSANVADVEQLPFFERINDQWRICFEWHNEDALDLEVKKKVAIG